MRAAERQPVAHTALEPQERDSYNVTAFADVTDRSLHAAVARFTGGLLPPIAPSFMPFLNSNQDGAIETFLKRRAAPAPSKRASWVRAD